MKSAYIVTTDSDSEYFDSHLSEHREFVRKSSACTVWVSHYTKGAAVLHVGGLIYSEQ